MTSDYSGVTCYRSQLKKDYWGDYGEFNLKRNLQEVSSPLNDPYPVKEFRGASYENVNPCDFELAPVFIGKTAIPFPQNSAALQSLSLNPAIPNMSVGCTFIVYPFGGPTPPTGMGLDTEDGINLTTEDGVKLDYEVGTGSVNSLITDQGLEIVTNTGSPIEVDI